MITYSKCVPITDFKKSRRVSILAVKLGSAWTITQNVGVKDSLIKQNESSSIEWFINWVIKTVYSYRSIHLFPQQLPIKFQYQIDTNSKAIFLIKTKKIFSW